MRRPEGKPSARSLRDLLVAAALCAACAAAYYPTVRSGHDWGGDFSMYLMNALNLAEGEPYARTPYLHDPQVTVGPRAYPPGLPVYLAAPIAIHGLSIEPLKRYMVVFPVLVVGLLYLLGSLRIPRVYAAGLAVVAASSPMLWDIKERILSDVPFLALLLATFWVAERDARTGTDHEHPWRSGLRVGLLACACIATRTVGLVLVPALVACDLWRRRRVTRATVLALALIGTTWGWQLATLGVEGDYVGLARTLSGERPESSGAASLPSLALEALAGLPERLRSLPGDLSVFWTWGNPRDGFTVAVTALLGLLGLCGVLVSWMRGPHLADFFIPGYLGLLLLLPSGLGTEGRLYLPVQVMLYLYAAIGCAAVHARTAAALDGGTGRQHIAAVVGLLPAAALTIGLATSYERSYSRLDPGEFRGGPTAPGASLMFEHIREHTPAGARFVFAKPRVLALFTGRRSAGVPASRSDEDLLAYLARMEATHVLTHTGLDHGTQLARAARARGMRTVYRTGPLRLYTFPALGR